MRYLVIALIIAALAVLVWVVGCKTQQVPNAQPPVAQNTTPPPAPVGHQMTPAKPAAGVTIAADEASCPVLGTVMKKSMMIPVQHDGKTYYLCCQDCIAKFKADPEKYINHPATPTREMKM